MDTFICHWPCYKWRVHLQKPITFRNINQTAVGLFWWSNNNLNKYRLFIKLKFIESMFLYIYVLKVCFIAKADNSNSPFLAKAANSTFHVLEFRKHWFNLCYVFRWSRCLTDVVVVIINCMDVITRDTQSFSFTIVTRCFLKDPWKHLCLYFPFSPWKRYHRFIEIIHPRSLLVSFDETPLS